MATKKVAIHLHELTEKSVNAWGVKISFEAYLWKPTKKLHDSIQLGTPEV